MTKADFFNKAIPGAIASGHLFAEYAVCEAALESGWGNSELAKVANDLFGQKSGFTTDEFETVEIKTRECKNGKWFDVYATWPKFPSWEVCFRERMELLRRSKLYAKALEAKDGETFIREVSKVWATDPHRADKVLATYRCNLQLIANAKTLMHAAKPAGAGA